MSAEQAHETESSKEFVELSNPEEENVETPNEEKVEVEQHVSNENKEIEELRRRLTRVEERISTHIYPTLSQFCETFVEPNKHILLGILAGLMVRYL